METRITIPKLILAVKENVKEHITKWISLWAMLTLYPSKNMWNPVKIHQLMPLNCKYLSQIVTLTF